MQKEPDFIKREAQANPWVEEALQRRETALDELVAQGGASADEAYHQNYRYWAGQAMQRKIHAGVEEPDSTEHYNLEENR